MVRRKTLREVRDEIIERDHDLLRMMNTGSRKIRRAQKSKR